MTDETTARDRARVAKEDAEWHEMVNAFVQDNLGSTDLAYGFLMGALTKLHKRGQELERLRALAGAPTTPIDVGIGDVVEFADDGGVLGTVTALVGPGHVRVEFPNGVTVAPAADLAVIRRALAGAPTADVAALRKRIADTLHMGLDDATPNDPLADDDDHERWVARVQEWADWVHEQYAPLLAAPEGAPTADVAAFVADTESRLPGLREPDPLSDWSKGVAWALDRARAFAAAPEGVDAADEQDIAKAAREYLAVTEGRAVTFVEGLARAALVRAVEAQDDPFGTTCIDCGEAIDDRRPSGTTADGDPIHTGCGDDDALADELTAAQAAIQRVRKLHGRMVLGGKPVCEWCRDYDEEPWKWPCPTVRALDGATTEEKR